MADIIGVNNPYGLIQQAGKRKRKRTRTYKKRKSMRRRTLRYKK